MRLTRNGVFVCTDVEHSHPNTFAAQPQTDVLHQISTQFSKQETATREETMTNPEAGEVLCAKPNGETHIESLMSTCENCGSPVVSVKLDANSEWSAWAHALTGQVECQIGAPSPPSERIN